METFQTTINCPDCGSSIIINTKQLLLGIKFGCHGCDTLIGLSVDSKDIVEKTIEKVEQLKNNNNTNL